MLGAQRFATAIEGLRRLRPIRAGASAVALAGFLVTPASAALLPQAACDRPRDLPTNAFEVQRAFTGRFEVVTQADGSTIRRPIFDPVPPGSVYNAPILDVGTGQASQYDQDASVTRHREIGANGQLLSGTYYKAWSVSADCQLSVGQIAFVPKDEPFGAPRAGITPSPTRSPSPTPTATRGPSPSPSPSVALSPTPSPSEPPLASAEQGMDGWSLLAVVLAGLWIGGVLENRFSRQYRSARQ